MKIGQTWQLSIGEVVTIVSLPDMDGWLRALSHDVGVERTYGSYGFAQPDAKRLEMKKAGHSGGCTSVELIRDLRATIKEIVVEVLKEQKTKKRRHK